jgi:hypothetical protein
MASQGDGPVRIQATEAKSSWIRYLVVVDQRHLGQCRGRDLQMYLRCCCQSCGKERRILKLDSNEEARVQAERVEADLEMLGLR